MASSLYSLAMESKFTEVFNRVRSHPEEAEFRNDNNWVTLHILVWKKAPLSALKAVYKAYPAGLQVRSKRGETALDMAENNNADEKIISFLKLSEHAQMRDCVLHLSLFQSRFNEIRETCESLVNDNTILKGQCRNLLKENEELKEHTMALKNSTDALKFSTDLLKKEFNSLAQQNKSLVESNDKDRKVLTSEFLSLKRDNEVAKIDWGTLKDESDKINEGLHSMKVANEELKDKNELLVTESEVLKKTVASLLGTCNYLSQDNEALKDICSEVRRRNDTNASSMNSNLQGIESTISHMQKDIGGLNSQSKKRDLFISALHTLMRDFDIGSILGDRKKTLAPGSPRTTICDL